MAVHWPEPAALRSRSRKVSGRLLVGQRSPACWSLFSGRPLSRPVDGQRPWLRSHFASSLSLVLTTAASGLMSASGSVHLKCPNPNCGALLVVGLAIDLCVGLAFPSEEVQETQACGNERFTTTSWPLLLRPPGDGGQTGVAGISTTPAQPPAPSGFRSKGHLMVVGISR